MRITKYIIPIGLMVLAISTRFVPHIPNFTAVGSVALLGGFWMRGKGIFILLPLLLLFLSDIALNMLFYQSYSGISTILYPGMGFVYTGHLAMIAWGNYLVKNPTKLSWLGHAAGANLVFFLLSNFGVWYGNPSIPQNILGLFTAYAAAVPFYFSMLLGTITYGAIMVLALSKAMNSALVKN